MRVRTRRSRGRAMKRRSRRPRGCQRQRSRTCGAHRKRRRRNEQCVGLVRVGRQIILVGQKTHVAKLVTKHVRHIIRHTESLQCTRSVPYRHMCHAVPQMRRRGNQVLGRRCTIQVFCQPLDFPPRMRIFFRKRSDHLFPQHADIVAKRGAGGGPMNHGNTS
jgi:hypothetical protein